MAHGTRFGYAKRALKINQSYISGRPVTTPMCRSELCVEH